MRRKPRSSCAGKRLGGQGGGWPRWEQVPQLKRMWICVCAPARSWHMDYQDLLVRKRMAVAAWRARRDQQRTQAQVGARRADGGAARTGCRVLWRRADA